jgi:hypothetical protein
LPFGKWWGWLEAQVKVDNDGIVIPQAIRAADCTSRQGENARPIGQSWARKYMIEQ